MVEAEPGQALPALALGDLDLVPGDEWPPQSMRRLAGLERHELLRDPVHVVLPRDHRPRPAVTLLPSCPRRPRVRRRGAPDRRCQPRTFPQIEDAIGWPRRRIASVLGGVSHLRHTEFGGKRPYRFLDERSSPWGRWAMWMDADQAHAIRRNS